jgi:hypothetical protein
MVLVDPIFGWLFSIMAGSYVTGSVGASILAARSRDWRTLFALPLAFATLHFAFGFGFLAGLVRFAGRWGDRQSKWSNHAARQAGECATKMLLVSIKIDWLASMLSTGITA